eukprot:TRINITY_DN17545_c0_g1_i2.p3 TRINITY_DN17545_c0_g1~~TRINITY_DN17545_c0_g1_i2.p3  ORF type:complete len:108 (+),score=31.45 TRINITY_DN17545_c0_g1_i2:209-532(+)
MSDDPSSLYRDYVHQHDGTAVAPAPERDFVSSDELNAAAAEHGGEVFDQNKNQEARDAAADLASGDSNDPSAMYRNLSLIHISEPTRLLSISYAVFCLKKKKQTYNI